MATTVEDLPMGGWAPKELVPRVDPKIAMESIRNLSIARSPGLLSPSYPKVKSSPSLGSILQTPPDLTPSRIEVKVASSPIRLPSSRRDAPLSYGVVVPAESESTRFEDPLQKTREFVDELPTAIDEAKKRADFRVKFSILREAYPQMNIPEPREDQPLEEIEVIYKQYIKRIHIDSSVEQNKIYLLILWLIIEVVGSRFLKLPLTGYTKNQFQYMSKYQMLLIELGERSYSASLGEGWPVELRLLAMAAFNGLIFVLVQMLAKKVGADGEGAGKMADSLRTMINEFLTQNKGGDVLRRAEEASSDAPPPPAPAEDAAPPLGGLGNLLATFAPMLANLGMPTAAAPAEKPQIRRPTTFGARRNRETTEH